MNDRIWYPINSLERESVILELTASVAFGKQNPIRNIILSNSTFYNLFLCIAFFMYNLFYVYFIVLENSARTNFFLKDTREGMK